ncbi:ECF-type sigma factor [soil metagenome]
MSAPSVNSEQPPLTARLTTAEFFPIVYDELRKLATSRIRKEPSQTLRPTDLVHETYLRLVGRLDRPQWESLGHFFAAAAQAMRRILVENARRKQRIKHGGQLERVDLDDAPSIDPGEDFLDLDDAITQLAATDALAAQIVELRYFAGLTNDELAESLAITKYVVHQKWAYARAWLEVKLSPPNA